MSEASRVVRVNGVGIFAEIAGDGRPVVLLHGFTGSTRSMTCVSDNLCHRYRTVSLDLVGHGRSEAPAEVAAYRMEACAAQVEGVLDALDVRDAHLLGYSMGGRVALALAAARPDRYASLVLVGAHAGIADSGARSQRVADDEALADRIEREGVPAFVEYWTELPLFAGQKRLGAECRTRHRAQRLDNRAHGLANSLRGMGAGAQPRLHDALDELRVPVLLAVGEHDEKFRALADDLAERVPNARVAVVQGVGHAAHVEDPAGFLRIARRFLASVDGAIDDTGDPIREDGRRAAHRSAP